MNNMKCWAVNKVLVPYVDQQLSNSEMDVIRKHLSVCSKCTQAHHDMVSTNKLLSEASIPLQKEEIFWKELENDIMHALPKKEPTKSRRFRWEFLEELLEDFQKEPVAVALSVLLSVILGVVQAFAPEPQTVSTLYPRPLLEMPNSNF